MRRRVAVKNPECPAADTEQEVLARSLALLLAALPTRQTAVGVFTQRLIFSLSTSHRVPGEI